MVLPTPRKGETRNDFINRCHSAIKGEFPDQKQRTAVCFSQFRKKRGGKPPKESMKIIQKLPFRFTEEFDVIQEAKHKHKDKRKIKGVMLKAGEQSRNNRIYTAEAVQNVKFSADTISLNHTENVEDNVGLFEGKVKGGEIHFEGEVMNTIRHPEVTELIDKGLARFVSIEAIAQEVERAEDNLIIKGGLDITGLGIVKTPGFPTAEIALAEAFRQANNGTIIDIDEDEEEDFEEDEESDFAVKDHADRSDQMEDRLGATVAQSSGKPNIKAVNSTEGLDMTEENKKQTPKKNPVEEKKETEPQKVVLEVSEEFRNFKEEVSSLKEEIKALKEKPTPKGVTTQESETRGPFQLKRMNEYGQKLVYAESWNNEEPLYGNANPFKRK